MATFALGSLLGKAIDQTVRVHGASSLMARLQLSLQAGDVGMVSALLYALQNAGPTVVHPRLVAAALAPYRSQLPVSLARIVSEFGVNSQNVSLPFNRSWTDGYVLGGKQVYAGFLAQAFVGTNFDCQQAYFDYEVYGVGALNVTLFQWSKDAFVAEAVYGKASGQPLADEVSVKVWNQVIYDKPLPPFNCSNHTFPIAHQQLGLSVTYTLWVSVIPIQFSAGAQLTLNLGVQYDVCDSTLSAIGLLPTATLSVGGQAELNLLIIKAGVRLTGSFESLLSPEVYVDGSKCSVGLEASLESRPMTINFDGYYAINKCKMWIWDCHWEQTHVDLWLHWSYPETHEVLVNEHWPIQP